MDHWGHLVNLLKQIEELDPPARVELLKEFAATLGYRVIKKLKEND